MKKYRAWGDYGPHMSIELPVFEAADAKEARIRAIEELKKRPEWRSIGEHNVSIQEYYPPKHDIIRL